METKNKNSIVQKTAQKLDQFYFFVKKKDLIFTTIFLILSVTFLAFAITIAYYWYPLEYNAPWFSYFTHLSAIMSFLYFLISFLSKVTRIEIFKTIYKNYYFKFIVLMSVLVTMVVYWVILFIPILIGKIQSIDAASETPVYVWALNSTALHLLIPLFVWIDFKMNKYEKKIETRNVYWLILWPLIYSCVITGMSYVWSFGGTDNSFESLPNPPYPFLDISNPWFTSAAFVALPFIFGWTLRYLKYVYNKNVLTNQKKPNHI